MLKQRIFHFLCAFTAIAILLAGCSFLRFADQCADISDRVVRLHVLADSDTEEAQALKLAVRDRLLTEADSLLTTSVGNRDEALQQLEALLPALTVAAQEELSAHGCALPVQLELRKTYFTTRTYGNFTLPAGTYDALRVIIGSGGGQNWWCILFPPLCLSASFEKSLDAVLTEEEMDIVSNYPQYEIRFKLVEWIQNLAQRLTSR